MMMVMLMIILIFILFIRVVIIHEIEIWNDDVRVSIFSSNER